MADDDTMPLYTVREPAPQQSRNVTVLMKIMADKIAKLEARVAALEEKGTVVVETYFAYEDVPHLHPAIDELRRALGIPDPNGAE